jgi:hypothetical protein
LFYGHMDQTILIDDEPSKALWNPKWCGLFLEPFKGHELSKNKVQWLDLASWLRRGFGNITTSFKWHPM